MYGIGVQDPDVQNISSFLKCESAKLPFTYLGLTVGANMGLVKNWKPVIDKIDAKLSKWKASNLSLGGRMTLCKAVLGSLPLYFLSLFKAPTSVIEELEALRRKFIWGVNEHGRNKISWVSWARTIAPKNLGGLGIGSIKAANFALLLKWWWRMMNNGEALWAKVVRSIHGITGRDPDSISRSKKAGVWLNIVKVGAIIQNLNINFDDFISRKIGKGDNTLF